MAREGCNLDKDEAEILKPSSSSTSTPAPQAPPQSTQPPLFKMTPPDLSIRKLETDAHVEVRVLDASPRGSDCKRKMERDEYPPSVQQMNRCTTCQKKVGLTGFRCRCGELFCARHRYSDAHECSFDYKAAGREEISKNNPVVRAAKIVKI